MPSYLLLCCIGTFYLISFRLVSYLIVFDFNVHHVTVRAFAVGCRRHLVSSLPDTGGLRWHLTLRRFEQPNKPKGGVSRDWHAHDNPKAYFLTGSCRNYFTRLAWKPSHVQRACVPESPECQLSW